MAIVRTQAGAERFGLPIGSTIGSGSGSSSLGGSFEGRVVIDPQKLAAWLRSPSGPLVRELFTAGDIVKAGAKKRVGVASGDLRDSIVKRFLSGPGGEPEMWVGSESEYAVFHHDGTDPHVIEPIRPGGVLSFVWAGERVFFKKVNHPGTKPNPFLKDALDDLRGRY